MAVSKKAPVKRRRRRTMTHHTPVKHRRRSHSLSASGTTVKGMAGIAIDVTVGYVAGKIAGNFAGKLNKYAGIAAPLVVSYLATKQFRKPYAGAGAIAAAVATAAAQFNVPLLNDAFNDPNFPLSANEQPFFNPNMITGGYPKQVMLPNGQIVSTMNDAPLSAPQTMVAPDGSIYAMNDNYMNDSYMNDGMGDGMGDSMGDGMGDYMSANY